MPNKSREEEKFDELLTRPESQLVDFKREFNLFGGGREEEKIKRAKFVKDIISMRNTPREEPAYIVYGVDCPHDSDKELHPLSEIPDESILQNKLSTKWCDPVPEFDVVPVKHDGGSFIYIEIPPSRREGPTICKADIGGTLTAGKYYYRKGTNNEIASTSVLYDILIWFVSGIVPASFKGPAQASHLRYFVSLSSALQRGGMAFPSAELFTEKKAFYLPEEQDSLNDIKNVLTSHDGERLVLITGDPSSGKTVLALTIGQSLLEAGYIVLYWKVNARTTYDTLWKDIRNADRERTLLIFDDIHLNFDLANELYYQYDKIKKASAIMISRRVQREERVNYQEDCLDLQDKLAADGRMYDSSHAILSNSRNKFIGVIEKHKEFWEAKNKLNLVVGDLDAVIDNCNNNLFQLGKCLDLWKPEEPLDSFPRTEILESISSRELYPLSKKERSILGKCAVLSQYEIPILIDQSEDVEARSLCKRGLLAINKEGFAIMPQAESAHYLFEAFSTSAEFRHTYESEDAFIVVTIRDYFRRLPGGSPIIDDTIKTLITQKEKRILLLLLGESEIFTTISRYYIDFASIGSILGFLLRTKSYVPESMHLDFASSIFTDAQQTKRRLLTSDKPLLYLVKISKLFHRYRKYGMLSFFDRYSINELLQFVERSEFYDTCYAFISLKKVDSGKAVSLSRNVNWENVAKKAQHSTFEKVLAGLKHLSWFHPSTAKKVFKAYIDETPKHFTSLDSNARFDELAEALNELNRLDSALTQDLFSRIPIELWKEKMDRSSLSTLAYGLSRIKDINYDGARMLLGSRDASTIANIARSPQLSLLSNAIAEINKIDSKMAIAIYDKISDGVASRVIQSGGLVHIGKALSELSKVCMPKTRRILSSIDIKSISASADRSDFKTIGKAFSELSKIDRNSIRRAYMTLDTASLTKKASATTIEGLGRALLELNNVDKAKTHEIAEGIPVDVIANRMRTESIIKIAHALTELEKVTTVKTREVFNKIPPDILLSKLNTEHIRFQKLGNLIRQLFLIDEDQCESIGLLQSIGVTEFAKIARNSRFSEYCSGIRNLYTCNAEVATEIMIKVGKQHATNLAHAEQIEKVMPSLRLLALVDHSLASEIWQSLEKEKVYQHLLRLPLTKLANSIFSIYEWNPNEAQRLLQSLDAKKLSARIRQSDKRSRQQALGKLRKIDSALLDSIKRPSRN